MALFIPIMVLYVMVAYLIRAPRSLYWVKGSLKFDKRQALAPWQGSGLLFFGDTALASVSIWIFTLAFMDLQELFLLVGAAYGLLLVAKVLAGKNLENLQDGLLYELTNPRIMAVMVTAIIACGLPDTLPFVAIGIIMTAFLLLASLFTTLFPIRRMMQNTL